MYEFATRAVSTQMARALGARATGYANLARGHHQELTAFEFVSVFREHGIEVFDFGVKACAGKPKKDDAGMGKFLVKDQFAEIPISNEENTFLVPGNGQHILIGKTWRVVARDDLHVMAESAKVGN
jgi:hypothetical protein